MERVRQVIALVMLFVGAVACSAETSRTPFHAPPPEFVDVAKLATRPDIATIVIGTIIRDLGEEKGPARDIYHRWEVVVEQFIVGQGQDRIVVRITQALYVSEGLPVPTKEPRFDVGEDVLLFLSKSHEGEIPLESNEFTILGPLSGKYIITNGLARAASWADAPSIPISELVAKIKAARKSQ